MGKFGAILILAIGILLLYVKFIYKGNLGFLSNLNSTWILLIGVVLIIIGIIALKSKR